jgi:ppGpp synthetase/RelA/SpoT-type nucleotidyltranferase
VTDDLEEVRKTWIKERPIYERFVNHVTAILRSEFRNPTTQIYGRPKEIDSLLKKLIRKPDKTYADITDKAGIRVIVKFSDELEIVGRFIEQKFSILKKEDKRTGLKIDQVGYQGIHYDIKLNKGEADGTEFADACAELQVRTLAQHLWSDMSHELGYKPDLKVDDDALRRLFRLSALIEIADDEFLRLQKDIQEMPGFDTHKILSLLEAQFYKFTAAAYDKELSITTIGVLNHLYGQDGLIGKENQFTEFCQQQANKLSHIFDINSDIPSRPLFLFQPESLMIFYLLERDKFRLREEWVRHYPTRELEQLAINWGTPYVS